MSVDIGAGSDSNFPSIEALFTDLDAPGLLDQNDYPTAQRILLTDMRDAQYAVLDQVTRLIGLQNKLHMSPHRKFPFDRWYADDRKPYEQVSDFIGHAQASGRPWYLQHVINVSHRPYPDGDARPLDIDPAAVADAVNDVLRGVEEARRVNAAETRALRVRAHPASTARGE